LVLFHSFTISKLAEQSAWAVPGIAAWQLEILDRATQHARRERGAVGGVSDTVSPDTGKRA
jgi:hypothetical protein